MIIAVSCGEKDQSNNVKNYCNMNSLDYIDSIFKIALDYYQNKDEVSVADIQSTLLSVHDKIKKELNNRFYKVCMDILEHNPQLANRHCCGDYMLPYDKVEIKFSKLL